ncbi:hypothetical protein B0H15DRAFT_456421 [Mycena belliarum]|uniref:ferric-chelate reductase (NADPH) n=1 Tax=Mycena belliarum TaxID=1033014 RepID=A0AAD6UE56_9AGAR|nr:hypothetical protein B0H15DRAFT_456421 [Mycena belliae]
MSAAPFDTGAPASGAPEGPPRFDDEMFVAHIATVLIALAALVVVLRIPRAFARLYRVSEWTRGHFLWYARPSAPARRVSVSGWPVPGEYTPYPKQQYSKEQGSSQSSHAPNFVATVDTHSGNDAYAPHLEPAPSFLRPVVSLLRSRVSPGVSVMQVVLCAAYLGVVLYASIYRSPGPFTDYNRFGYIAISQVPFIVGFATKNNVLGSLLGLGYEKINFMHRFAARLAIIAAHIHGLGYIATWCNANEFMEKIAHPKNYFGLCILLCFDGLILFSSAFVRQRAYNLFFISHIICFQGVLICSCYHYPQLLPYIYISIALYGFDKLMRLTKTRISTATIRPIPELGLTRVELPYLNKGWRAGQHVRIQVLSSGMGLAGWAEVHPFTIASESSGQEGIVLMCKKTGTWTQNLFATATANQSERGIGRDVKLIVEGPYGGPGFVMFNSFSAAIFIAGGSGITFALGAIQELVRQDLRGESRVRVIELIWIIQDPAGLPPLIPQFVALIEQSAYAQLTIAVHYTKAPAHNMRVKHSVHPGLKLTAGRPRLIAALEGAVIHATSSGAGERCGLIVGVCGPTGLADDVVKAVSHVNPKMRDEIGGIEIHEETFGW